MVWHLLLLFLNSLNKTEAAFSHASLVSLEFPLFLRFIMFVFDYISLSVKNG